MPICMHLAMRLAPPGYPLRIMTDTDSRRLLEVPRRGVRQLLSVEVVREGGDWTAFEPADDLVGAVVDEIAADHALDFGEAEATIALATDARVRELNLQYRGKDKPTNVLSFPSAMPIEAGMPTYLGDIILAAETLAREAAELGIAPRHHFQHLCLHGLLHLLGFDHVVPADAAIMEAMETRILARLGIADPYKGMLDDADDSSEAD